VKLKQGDVFAWVRGKFDEMISRQARHVHIDKYTNHQQKATSVMNMGELKNLPLLKTTVDIWAMLIKGTE
jgi:hypothetical protein